MLLDVDQPLLSVDEGHLSLDSLVLASHDEDLVVLTNGQGADAISLSQILGQMSTHQSVSNV